MRSRVRRISFAWIAMSVAGPPAQGRGHDGPGGGADHHARTGGVDADVGHRPHDAVVERLAHHATGAENQADPRHLDPPSVVVVRSTVPECAAFER